MAFNLHDLSNSSIKWSSLRSNRLEKFDDSQLSKVSRKKQIEILQAKNHNPPYVQKKVPTKNEKEEKNILNFYLKENPYARLHHPNILYFYSSKRQDNTFFFDYEYCDMTLSEYLSQNKDKQFTEQEIQLFTKQILNAMNIIENIRKVKCCILNPDAIFLNLNTNYLIPKIKYFSGNYVLTKRLQNEDFLYLAPELLVNKFTIEYPEIPSSNTFWALGLIIFEMFFGYYLFGKNKDYFRGNKDNLEMAITKGYYEIPTNKIISFELLTFIHGLLCDDSCKRINWKDVTQQPFLMNKPSEFTYCDFRKKGLDKVMLNIKKQNSITSLLIDKYKNRYCNNSSITMSIISNS